MVLGITFKENCTDVRNTKVIDIIKDLKEYGVVVDVMDPVANKKQVYDQLQINVMQELPKIKYDGVVLAVAHKQFENIKLEPIKKSKNVVYDVKGFPVVHSDHRL